MRSILGVVGGLGLALLTGCAMETTAGPRPGGGLAIQGGVHGGQQPIAGARVYLFAANTTGYGNASVSLLTSVPQSTTLDTSGGPTNGDYYATTAADGTFTLTGDYTCTPGTQVYLYALGGNPGLGSGVNAASGLMAAAGACPSADNFVSAVPFVQVNEVTTIAAAYAFAGFAMDATHVSSSGTALAQVGIANAFANAGNLASISTGAALATTPAGNGVVPQTTINTLADILSACVNSTGAVTGPTTATACYTLFNNALAGGTTGAVPGETATAAINIAHNPGLNVGVLFGLVGSSPPFVSTLGVAPNDFTIGLNFSGGGINKPFSVTIDGQGNAWTGNQGGRSVSELSNVGAPISPAGGYTNGMGDPNGIAIDSAGNVWVADFIEALDEFSSAGVPISPLHGFRAASSPVFPDAIAVDASGNIWVTNSESVFSSLVVFNSSGTDITRAGCVPICVVTPYSDSSARYPESIAFDSSGQGWVGYYGEGPLGSPYAGLAAYASTGTLEYSYATPPAVSGVAVDASGSVWMSSYFNVYKVTGANAGSFAPPGSQWGGLAIDGLGNVWLAGPTSVAELSNTGAVLSPSGYTGGGIAAGYQTVTGTYIVSNLPTGVTMDGSGDVWTANTAGSTLTELIGAAAPVVTPMVAAVKSNMLGTRP